MRISFSGIEEKRPRSGTRILITGGTGFLGSHVAAKLLEAGYAITLLARSTPTASAAQRVHCILDWHGVSSSARRNLQVVEGDLLHSELVMSERQRCRLLSEVDEIVHCASETSFAERKRNELEAVNIGGVERVLDFASAGHCHTFHYISTAFVAGRRSGFCPERLPSAREFHNVYEETKCRAERIVWQRCREAGMRSILYRPSIVYGHSVTGRSLLFNAVYYPVRALVFLRDSYRRDIREGGGRRAGPAGVEISPDGTTLHLPLRVVADGPGIDLIPIDFFAEVFFAIFENAFESGIYHIVNGESTPVATILQFVSRMFGLRGVEVVGADLFGKPRNPIESSYARMIDAYQPYMSDRRKFSVDKSRALLRRSSLSCPPFTYEVFHRCMDYAVDRGWNRDPASCR